VHRISIKAGLLPLRQFLRDFCAFAGSKGVRVLLFVFLGAIVEGVGLVLLVPFFSVIINAQNAGGWVQSISAKMFELVGVENRLAKVSLLGALLALLLVARVVIITVRDVTLAELKIGFVQLIRSRITRRLAAAKWEFVSRLRHSRITHLMSVDVHQLEDATDILLRDTVAVVMLASQILLALLLAPLLTVFALGVVLAAAVTLLPMLRRARQLGHFVTDANLSLIDEATQFLGGLKIAISQNLQNSFVREFESMLGNVGARQIRYVREQTMTGLTISAVSGLVGLAAILLGVAVFDIPASVLIALLLIVSRMNAPAIQLQLDAQHFARVLPAYETIRALELELTAAAAPPRAVSSPAIRVANGPIEFDKVSFFHNEQEIASGAAGGVRDLDLIIERGSILGITGPSGAGKTTLSAFTRRRWERSGSVASPCAERQSRHGAIASAMYRRMRFCFTIPSVTTSCGPILKQMRSSSGMCFA
jgi:ATP-binding cassette subfamily C protein